MYVGISRTSNALAEACISVTPSSIWVSWVFHCIWIKKKDNGLLVQLMRMNLRWQVARTNVLLCTSDDLISASGISLPSGLFVNNVLSRSQVLCTVITVERETESKFGQTHLTNVTLVYLWKHFDRSWIRTYAWTQPTHVCRINWATNPPRTVAWPHSSCGTSSWIAFVRVVQSTRGQRFSGAVNHHSGSKCVTAQVQFALFGQLFAPCWVLHALNP